MSSPLSPGRGSSVSVLENVLAERTGLRRRRGCSLASPLGSSRALRGALPQAAPWSGRSRGPEAGAPRILVVAEDTQVRLAVARELAPRFGLLHALSFTSAARKLQAGESFGALIIDLGLSDARGASWFLARLVDGAFEGPRLLLSRAMRREHASSLSQSCVSHFTVALPWARGELHALLASALGLGAAPASRDM